MLTGISVHAYKETRMRRENLMASQLEQSAYYRHVVYWGRQFLTDVDTGNVAKGPLKIGKSVSATSCMRQRNEGGGNFKILAEMSYTKGDYDAAEKTVQNFLNHYSIAGDNGQKELFNLPDSEVVNKISEAYALLDSKFNRPDEILLFTADCWAKYTPGSPTIWFTPKGELIATVTDPRQPIHLKTYTRLAHTDHEFLEFV